MKPKLKLSKALGCQLLSLGLSSLVALSFSGCGTLKKQAISNALSSGRGFSKIKIEDKRKGRTFNLHLNYLINEPNLNLSISHPIGISLARLNMVANQFNFLSVKDRTHYFGEPKPEVLKKAFDLEMHPKYLFNVLQGKVFRGPEWSCNPIEDLTNCKNLTTDLTVVFYNNKPEVKILHPKTWITINRVRFEERNGLTAGDFKFSGPNSYKKVKL